MFIKVAQTVKTAYNAGDLSSITGLGRFPGEGNGDLLQYSFFFYYLVFNWRIIALQNFVVFLSNHNMNQPHSSVLVWRIPWTEEPGRPQSIGLQKVEHGWDWACIHIQILKRLNKYLCSCHSRGMQCGKGLFIWGEAPSLIGTISIIFEGHIFLHVVPCWIGLEF